MRGAPRAAIGSPPDRVGRTASRRWPADRRLRSPAQFAAVTSDPQALRAGRRWLAVAGRAGPRAAGGPPTRFGFTASRRQARRAVDRNAVKRVLREAARSLLPELDAAAADRTVDIVLRLKSPLPAAGALPRRAWKAALRAEAESLLAELAQRLRSRADP
jgi:ribonuclease P protein component